MAPALAPKKPAKAPQAVQRKFRRVTGRAAAAGAGIWGWEGVNLSSATASFNKNFFGVSNLGGGGRGVVAVHGGFQPRRDDHFHRFGGVPDHLFHFLAE